MKKVILTKLEKKLQMHPRGNEMEAHIATETCNEVETQNEMETGNEMYLCNETETRNETETHNRGIATIDQ